MELMCPLTVDRGTELPTRLHVHPVNTHNLRIRGALYGYTKRLQVDSEDFY